MKEKISKIIVHWTSSGSKTTVEDIRAWHKAKGWKDIGYHRVILHPDSIDEISLLNWENLVKKGRPINDDTWLEDWEKGAHTLNENHDSVGVCVVGSAKYPLHPLQGLALINTLDILVKRFGLTRKDVKCHREFNKTICPGGEIFNNVITYRMGKVMA